MEAFLQLLSPHVDFFVSERLKLLDGCIASKRAFKPWLDWRIQHVHHLVAQLLHVFGVIEMQVKQLLFRELLRLYLLGFNLFFLSQLHLVFLFCLQLVNLAFCHNYYFRVFNKKRVEYFVMRIYFNWLLKLSQLFELLSSILKLVKFYCQRRTH